MSFGIIDCLVNKERCTRLLKSLSIRISYKLVEMLHIATLTKLINRCIVVAYNDKIFFNFTTFQYRHVHILLIIIYMFLLKKKQLQIGKLE